MGCNKWEEVGLLFSSGELEEPRAKEYEAHLRECEECKIELETYQKEKNDLFTIDMLGEEPSRKVSDEILRVCSSARKQVTHVGFFPLFFKKTLYSVTFFVMGFVVVGYFAINMENAERKKHAVSLEGKIADSSTFVQPATANVNSIAQKTDSAKSDSLVDSALYYSKTRGNLNTKGVYTVDLKDK